MKKVFLSLAAGLCFAISASAQTEVPGAVNNNSVPSDENVHAPTKMDMREGMQNVQRAQSPEAARAGAQYENTQTPVSPNHVPGTNRGNDADVNNIRTQQAAPVNNSGTAPKTRSNTKTNSSTR